MDELRSYSPKDMRLVLIACCAGIFLTPLMSTMMNLALVHIGADFDVGSHSLALVNTVFLLSSVVAMVPAARLSDIHGRKKTMVAGLLVTTAGAVVAVFSPTFEVFLSMRLVMGVGAAAISVSSMALLTEVFPFERRGWAIGVQTTFVYLGMALGPTLGGFISDGVGWRGLFFFILPFSAVSMTLLSKFKYDVVADRGGRMDSTGSAVYAATVVLTIIGAVNLPAWWAFALLFAGLALLAAFVSMMRSRESPVLDLSVFKHKVFSRSCLAAFMNYASSYSVSFFLALYLQHIGALTASQAGLIMLTQAAFQIVLTSWSGGRSDRMRDKRILPTTGMALTCIAIVMILFLGTEVNYAYIAVILALLGIGYGMFSAPNSNAVMSSVPPRNRGEAAGMLSVVRQVGMLTSMSIAMLSISVIMGSADNLNPSTFGDFINVIRAAFVVCLVMCVIGTAVSWLRGPDILADVRT
ncbi:MAG: MFS transporter [Candidatus Methanoplasma sp.]|jgi:MFS family permease|nr:MFS transporter [Candidatus Methanoplasma sp.]